MTKTRSDTRARILRTAAELFQRQGYGATGLNQVLAESGAPKGSLYFHFPQGKEQLAAEAVALAGGEMGVRMASVVGAAGGAREAVVGVGELLAEGLRGSDFRDGCPVATVALEQAGGEGPISEVCHVTYASWVLGFADALRGWGAADDEADELAELVMSSLQGALLLAQVRRDTSVLSTVSRRVAAVVVQSLEQQSLEQETGAQS
ncbi:TetR/AcrR family transcriptional regulator [Streptomyces sp. NPDC002855]|uniref:TetR/AcrR family transcriptional regulator n=1 Tax=unclassified Streptomyces TaxID=2593676 RepID=UPI003325719C